MDKKDVQVQDVDEIQILVSGVHDNKSFSLWYDLIREYEIKMFFDVLNNYLEDIK